MSTFPPANQDGNPFHAGLPDSVTLTPAIYNASLPAPVLALLQMPNGTQAQVEARVAQATLLHAENYVIDMALVMWQWDPTTTMYLRQTAGLATVPDAFGAPNMIKVSTDAADYPPVATATPAPTPSTDLVGVALGYNMFATGPGVVTSPASALNVSAGEQVTQDGAVYTAHVGMSLMGPSVYFTKN